MTDLRVNTDMTEQRREAPITIVHGDQISKVHLSSLLECIELLELKYKITKQPTGFSLLQVFGPNKTLEFEIVEVLH